MKRRSLSIVSLLIVFMTVVNLFAGTLVFAGETTADNAIEIGNATDLKKIGKDANYPLNGNYILTADIDLGGAEWTPIGNRVNDSTTNHFSGTFDGNGKTVSNFTITVANTADSSTHYGFFNSVEGGTVKNLKLASATIIANAENLSQIGAVVGRLYVGGTISGCETANDVVLNVTGCKNNCYVGGIVGYALDTVEYCVSNTQVNLQNIGMQFYVGGIAGGFVHSELINSVNRGTVTVSYTGTGNSYVAGICGRLDGWSKDASIKNCINEGTVTVTAGGTFAGGIAGDVKGAKTKMLMNNINLGTVSSATAANAAQLVGKNNASGQLVGQGNLGVTDAGALCTNVANPNWAGYDTEANIKASDAYKAIIDSLENRSEEEVVIGEKTLVYTVDFRGDATFSPVALGTAGDNFDFTPSADGSALTIKGKETGTDKTRNFWGGTFAGLTADTTTIYTMVYAVKANGNAGKNNSVGIGGWIVDGKVELYKDSSNKDNIDFYNNYSNHNEVDKNASAEERRAALSLGCAKIGDYKMFNTLAAYEEDAEGFVTMKVVYDGYNRTFVSYILSDNKTGENDEDWIKIEEQSMTMNLAPDAFGFMIYAHYNCIDTTIKNVRVYKQVVEADEVEMPTYSGGKGTAEEPYLISTKEDLQTLATFSNSFMDTTGLYYSLTTDLDLSASGVRTEWTPIGIAAKGGFKGVFDGNGKTISGFTVTGSEAFGDSAGLFGWLNGNGTVKDLKIANAVIICTYSDYAGAVAGSVESSAKISGCVVADDVSVVGRAPQLGGSMMIGGIAGLNHGSIEYCENAASVTVESSDKISYAAGIAGANTGKIRYCVNLGDVVSMNYEGKATQNSFVSGIQGYCMPWSAMVAKVEYCVNHGSIENVGAEGVETSYYAGGIVARMQGTGAEMRTVSNCYNFGEVKADYAGQILGTMGVVLVDWSNTFAVKGLGYISGDDSAEYGAVLLDPVFVLQAELYQNAGYLAIVSEMTQKMKFAPAALPTPPTITDINFGELNTDNSGDNGDTGNTGDAGNNGNTGNAGNTGNTGNNGNQSNNSGNETTAPETTPTTSAPTEEKKGCGSVASLALLPMLTLGAAITVCKKKKD